MILRITDTQDYSMKYVKLSMAQFSNKEYHPYIASNSWDYVLLDFVENTPHYIISQIRGYLYIVPYIYKEKLSTINVMRCIVSLYPDDAAVIRSAFKNDKDKYLSLLDELGERYKWEYA